MSNSEDSVECFNCSVGPGIAGLVLAPAGYVVCPHCEWSTGESCSSCITGLQPCPDCSGSCLIKRGSRVFRKQVKMMILEDE